MPSRIEKIKTHLSDHKVTYYVGAGCLTVGALAGAAIFGYSSGVIQVTDAFKIQICSPTTNNISATLIRRGHPGFAVICKETGVQWASINHAAASNGITPTTLANHLSGKNPHAGGKTYEILGEIPNVISQK